MILNPQGKKLVFVVIIAFVIAFSSIFLVRWFDENVVNPRIWKNWSCSEMQEFAMNFEDENLSDFQRARFHDDLSKCLESSR